MEKDLRHFFSESRKKMNSIYNINHQKQLITSSKGLNKNEIKNTNN